MKEIDKRKLISVELEDGSIVPIGNPDDYEMIINDEGDAVIQLKKKKERNLEINIKDVK